MSRKQKQKRPFDFTLPPRSTTVQAYSWLRDELRSAIKRGAARPGERIPATREIAREYGLSRGTVMVAIDELRAEGYLYGVKGSGTFVSRELPNRFFETSDTSGSPSQTRVTPETRISSYAKAMRPFSHFTDLKSRAFRTNLPAVDKFPTTLWAQIVSRRLKRVTTQDLLWCPSTGYEPLRIAIAKYLAGSRGVNCNANQVLIVSGIQEALDLVARLLLDAGDRVLIEDPGYQVAYLSLEAARAKIIPVPIDSSGAAPVKQQFRNSRLIYLTPGHQFPIGVTMPVARRLQILRHASEAGTYIFEDDYDSEYRYSGSPLPALQGLDHNGNVIFAGSFSKTLFPTLRLGYLVLPLRLVEIFKQTKALINRHHSVADQGAVCEFIEEGHMGRHLRQMRRLYAARRDALFYYAGKYWTDHLALPNVETGVQAVGWLKQGLNAELVCAAAAAKGIDVVPLSRYVHKFELPQGLQIGFAAIDEREIEKGVKTLAGVMESLVRGALRQ